MALYVGSSLFLGCAILTRYIGIAFLPAASVIVYVSGFGYKLRRRLMLTFAWFSIAFAPLVIYFIRNISIGSSITNRSFMLHPIPFTTFITRLIKVIFNFILPISISSKSILAIFGLIAIILVTLIILLRQRLKDNNWRSLGIVMPVSCLLFTSSYLLFLFISITFFDAITPVDKRILSPVLILLIVGVFSSIWTISQTIKISSLWLCFLIFITYSISIKTPKTIQSASSIQINGLGYTNRLWQSSETMAFVKLIPDGARIFSNGSDVINFLTGKQSLWLPKIHDMTSLIKNIYYDEEISTMCKDINEKGAILVYFNRINKSYLPNKNNFQSICKLPILQIFSDGIVFGNNSITSQ